MNLCKGYVEGEGKGRRSGGLVFIFGDTLCCQEKVV